MSLCKVTRITSLGWNASVLNPVSRRYPFSFYDIAWLVAWEHAFIPGKDWCRPLTTYSVMADGLPLGFLALAPQSIHRLRINSLAGFYWPCRTLAVQDHDGAIAQFARVMADYFISHPPGLILRFGPVSTRDRAMDALLRALVARGWHPLRQKRGAVYELLLPSDPVEFEARTSKSLLKSIHYLRRRLIKSRGSVWCERRVLGEHPDALLDTLARIEAASWVARGGEPKFIGKANRMFWLVLAQARERCAEVVMWIMWCGEIPVAFSAHIETADTLYIIANSYDEEWKAYSPGSILSLEILVDACRRGNVRVDWGLGDSGYKSRWGATCGTTELFDVVLVRPGLRGHAITSIAKRWLAGWQSVNDE